MGLSNEIRHVVPGTGGSDYCAKQHSSEQGHRVVLIDPTSAQVGYYTTFSSIKSAVAELY